MRENLIQKFIYVSFVFTRKEVLNIVSWRCYKTKTKLESWFNIEENDGTESLYIWVKNLVNDSIVRLIPFSGRTRVFDIFYFSCFFLSACASSANGELCPNTCARGDTTKFLNSSTLLRCLANDRHCVSGRNTTLVACAARCDTTRHVSPATLPRLVSHDSGATTSHLA